MIFKSDPRVIRDAKENVDNARYEIQISKIDKTISKLEEARDKETDAIDDMISKLEEYKDAWNDITSVYAEKQEDLIAAQILGANWETDILNGRLDVLDAFKNQYIDIQQAIVDAAWMSANEQIKAAKEAEKGSSGSASKAPKIDSNIDTPQTSNVNSVGSGAPHTLGGSSGKRFDRIIQAYASGTTGIPKAEKNALVSEYGQTEMTVLPNGDAIITDEPTLMDLPKGTVIYNEKQTKQIMDNKVDVIGKAHANGTANNTTVPAKHIAPDIYPEMDLWERMERCATALGRSVNEIMNPMHIIAHNMQEMTSMGKYMNNINNVSSVTNNNRPSVNIEEIRVICPGVTDQQVAEKLPGVLDKALDQKFSGFSNFADQWSRR